MYSELCNEMRAIKNEILLFAKTHQSAEKGTPVQEKSNPIAEER